MVKYFSSTITNRNNYNDVLEQHPYFLKNQLEQGHTGTRIAAACKLIKPALSMKRGAVLCCREFKTPEFLTEEDWRTVRKFEGILSETCRLTKIC